MQPSKTTVDISNLYTKYNGILKSGNNPIRSVGIGLKSVGGHITDIPAVVFNVKEKKSINDLDPNKIIPKKVMINGVEYRTDVVQVSNRYRALDSEGCYGTNLNSYAADHKKIFRWYPPVPESGIAASGNPVQGGISIGQNETGIGTLGCVVADTVNGKLCGLTNSHVLVKDAFLASEKLILKAQNKAIQIYNIKDKSVKQPGESLISSPQIGHVKRYGFLYFWNWNSTGQFVYHNYIDAAICSLQKISDGMDNAYIVWEDSSKQFNMKFLNSDNGQFDIIPTEYPFATEEEINNLQIAPNGTTRVWKSGRTTGFVGKGSAPDSNNEAGWCELELIGKNETVEVYGYAFSQFVVSVIFSDCLKFAYKLVNGETVPRPGAILGGDSGSVLIADINGTKKIIGLNFAGGPYSDQAGDGSVGFACKISHVAEQLAVNGTSTKNMFDSPDNPLINNYFDDKNQWKFVIQNGLSSNKTISDASGVYYQCGLYK